ncbi:MAG: hypothetical protein CMQ24_18415, partial [Gammaproteobacteria bacterium]|nr:hypothetical protein [Gammaproteobacteria bacterium]
MSQYRAQRVASRAAGVPMVGKVTGDARTVDTAGSAPRSATRQKAAETEEFDRKGRRSVEGKIGHRF